MEVCECACSARIGYSVPCPHCTHWSCCISICHQRCHCQNRYVTLLIDDDFLFNNTDVYLLTAFYLKIFATFFILFLIRSAVLILLRYNGLSFTLYFLSIYSSSFVSLLFLTSFLPTFLKLHYLNSFLFSYCFAVNAGKSFTLETSLPVNDGNLNALSMYNSLIGVAFDNGGETGCLFLVLSYLILFSIVFSFNFIHFTLSLTAVTISNNLVHSHKPHAGNSYVKQSAPTSMPSYSPNFVSSRPTSTHTRSPSPAPTNTPTVVRTPYGPYRPHRLCHWWR